MEQKCIENEKQELLIKYKELYGNLVELEKAMEVIDSYIKNHPEETEYINEHCSELSGCAEYKIHKTFTDIKKAKDCVLNIYKKLSENNLYEYKDLCDRLAENLSSY